MDEESKIRFSFFLFVVLIVAIFAELAVFIYMYATSDKVECNLLWCSFKKGELVESRITTSSQCSINNVTINCSDMPDWDDEISTLDGR